MNQKFGLWCRGPLRFFDNIVSAGVKGSLSRLCYRPDVHMNLIGSSGVAIIWLLPSGKPALGPLDFIPGATGALALQYPPRYVVEAT